ncbi:hypothetical protein [Alteromonas gilva]|uniref:Uncharacterized protein n=1 Tax=Alteromonas gilva TaxID=2987522 RepID=A0ABT5L4N4_9ALTE|nr:hypothetical protein [Alteromonas gilva]MDC8832000.1 hypothetical protein [Alteromonas gilva]
MKLLLTVLSLLLCSAAQAHDDHALNATFHEFYHFAFYSLLALVVLKGIQWGVKRLQKQSKEG